MKKFWIFFGILLFTAPVWAIGSIIAVQVLGLAAGSFAAMAVGFAINMIASAILNKTLFAPSQPSLPEEQRQPNPGNRQQIPPATDNKLPVVYGDAWVGGTIVDLSITENNQDLYYVLALAEVTNTNSGQTPDTITFGDIYYGGKKVTFQGDGYTVASLTDESSGEVNTQVAGKIQIFLYSNGSNSPANSSQTAIQVMQNANLIYKWDASKLMSNCAFMILHLTYNQDASITSLEQTRVQVKNSRYQPGDCFYDYLINTRYGAALPEYQIDTDSLDELNTYSNQSFTYTTYEGGTSTQARFRFDGTLDTSRNIMENLQNMASCCDCLLKYNEIFATWGVIVQKPTYDVAMNLDDSNIISAISITPIDLANSFNIAECKFPDKGNQDAFNTATFDLAQVDPSLLYPNEPVNKQTINLPLVNDDVRAQYLANRFLESAREDLQVDCSIGFTGIQLEAGDIVTLTNVNYGWSNKLFRISKVTQTFEDTGAIICKLMLMEFNPSVYDDVNVTQFTPAPNTGISSPTTFGTISAPTITNIYPSAAIPSFDVNAVASTNGIVQYAEIWYSAYQYPTTSQYIFSGTTAVNANGSPYLPNQALPAVTLGNIPRGDWYFFVRMVNSLGTSNYSSASTLLEWRPTTLQFSERWIAVAYADNADGTSGFSYDPRNKAYYGLYNNDTANGGTNPALYTWYTPPTGFNTLNYLLYTNRQNRKFSFSVGNAGYVNLGGSFVPTETSIYDPSLWSALVDPASGLQSFIDLDERTGQTIVVGSTGNNINDGFLSVTNTTSGAMKVNLQQFLNFGAGIYSKSFNAATLTIDIYGRVVGFTEADSFYYTEQVFTASASQTTFSFTHTVGWIIVFRDGCLLSQSDYTETGTTVVMNNACTAGENIVIVYARGVSTSVYYEPLNITIASSTTNTITYDDAPWNQIQVGDQLSFTNTGTPTLYTVSAVNPTTKVVTFSTSIAGATAGLTVYRYRAAGSSYAPFTRYEQSVSEITTFTPTTYSVNNGFESIYVNGAQISEVDYNITDGTIDGFPAHVNGNLDIIMWMPNNLGVPASNIANNVIYSTTGLYTYIFSNNPLSMAIYANGALLTNGSDFTATSTGYTLTTPFNNSYTLLNQQTFARVGAA